MATRPTTGPKDVSAREVTAAERHAARDRREQLQRGLLVLEEALTSPASLDGWLPRVTEAIAELRETVIDHVAGSEAPDGLLAQVADVSPWLGPRVEQLRAEHDDLVASADALVEACAEATTSDDIADAAWALLERVSRHRSRGADLLYDAYALDISAGD
jgi:hypothetical protein